MQWHHDQSRHWCFGKRRPLRAALLVCSMLITCSLPGAANAAAVSHGESPNIVLIVMDDLGFTDLGAYGSEIRTPVIDSLAQTGAKFSNFHAAAMCSPTRAMLLTGVDSHLNGQGAMTDLMPEEHRGKKGYLGHLADDAVTLASMLRDNGYFTLATGKWHLGYGAQTLPPRRGFDRSYIQAHGSSDNWEQRPWLPWEDGEWFEDGKPATLPSDYYSSTFIVDKAIEYLDSGEAQKRPFFAYVAFQAVHIPVQAPREFSDHYQGVYDAGWSALREERRARAAGLGLVPEAAGMVKMASTADWDALDADQQADQARRMEVYAGMAEAMDFNIGRLVQHLKATRQADNTVFIVLSDNGAEAMDPHEILPFRLWLKARYNETTQALGDKGAYAFIGPSWASAAVSPLNTYKAWAGEGALRVPLVISGAPDMPHGQLISSFAHVSDIVPTVLALAGIAPHAGRYNGQVVQPLRGKSLLPVLQGRANRTYSPDEPVGYELHGNAALFKGDYKLVKNLRPVGDGQWHLYNIAVDPGEVIDLKTSLPELFQNMRDDYEQYVQTSNVLPVPDDYDYKRQGARYAVFHYVLPRLAAYAPYIAACFLVGGAWWFMRRRRLRR